MSKNASTVRVRATLQSIGNGMLMNPMLDKTLDELQTGKREPIDKSLSKEAIAASRVIRDFEGNPGFPIEYLLPCLVEAGRSVKNGKKQVSTAGTTTIYDFLEFGDLTFIKFKPIDKNQFPSQIQQRMHADGYLVDRRKGNMHNASKSTAVAIIRPLFPKWEVVLEFTVNTEAPLGVDVGVVKQLFEFAGSRVGLGDYRPAKRGPFGRFQIADWKIL